MGRIAQMGIWMGLALGCGGSAGLEAPMDDTAQGDDEAEATDAREELAAEPAPIETPAEPEPTETVEPRSEPPPLPEGPEPPAGTLEQALYWGLEAREYATPMPSPGDAIGCAPFEGAGEPDFEWYEQCRIQDVLARTDRGWVVLQVDSDDGGIHELHLFEGNARRKRERISGDLTPQRVEALRRRLQRPGLQSVEDRVGRASTLEFSLAQYHPLVELEGTEWLLWAETVHDLDDPEWVLWLVSPDGETRHEIARRRAELGACDGGGYWCESTQAECDDAGLRAEGRLCVLPLGLDRVAIHERELALLGSVNQAGHGLMGGLTWIVTLPAPFESAPSE